MDVPLSPDPVCEFEAHVASQGDVDFRPPAFSDEALALNTHK